MTRERGLDPARVPRRSAFTATPRAAPPRPDLLSPPRPFRRRQAADHVIHEDSHADERLVHAVSVARGLSAYPRALDCRYLYDDEGAFVFEKITEQPEYYPTRTEDQILAAAAHGIRARTGDVTLVELGSGSSSKTRRLLDAFTARGPTRYIPIDISPALDGACHALASRYPNLHVEGIAADYDRGLSLLGAASPLCLIFLGSSIGNFTAPERDRFLELVSDRLSPGDFFLLGIDLVKDPARLEAAYNDAAGWTARFTKNLFLRMNRDFGAAIPEAAIEHVAFYNDRQARIEIYGRFLSEVRIDLPLIGSSHRIAAGELVLAEISCKFRAAEFAAGAARFGLDVEETYRDPDDLFAVQLFRRRARHATATIDTKAHVSSLLHRLRCRTLEIVAPLIDSDLSGQWSPNMGPLAWDLGHIASFEKRWLLERVSPNNFPRDAAYDSDEALEEHYDPVKHPRSVRASLPLPDRAAVLVLLEETRAAVLARLRAIDFDRNLDAADPTRPLLAGGYVYAMTAQHEAQHQETMLAALQLRADFIYDPPSLAAPFVSPSAGPSPGWPAASGSDRVFIPAGRFLLGTDDRTVAYDNERPLHEVELPAFFMDAAPVTNRAFVAFIDDGGYARRELWSDEGWRFVGESGATAPLHWVKDGEPRGRGGVWLSRRFGRLAPVHPEEPVIHVSWFEADAFSRWAKKRLPTEAEWEKAAAWDPERQAPRIFPWGDAPPTSEHANLDQRLYAPAPAYAYPRGQSFYGCHQMMGDVWEWTSSWFQPYPGFVAFPYAAYSRIHFGERYRVLRGGSWATERVAIRCSFRNWDYPERRQIFAGFRCASDG